MFRSFLATIIKYSIKFLGLRKYYFGFYKRYIKPYNLFRSVRKTIVFKKNIKLELCIEDWIQQQLYLFGTYEDNELKYIETNLKPGNIFVDIGANIGIYSLTAANIVKENGKVLAFEPFSKNFDKLQKHVQINNFKNIIFEKIAISDKAGTITIYINELEQNCGLASTIEQTYTSKEVIEAITLDEYLANHKIPHVDFIKMDIEGAEMKALHGMQHTLQKCKPILLIELDEAILEKNRIQKSDIIQFLEQFNYKMYSICSNGSISEYPSQKVCNNNNFIFKANQ